MTNSTYVKVDGVSLDVRRWTGVGDPILLLHEALGAATMWQNFPERLATCAGRPVIAWSRQGYGRSDPFGATSGLGYLEDEGARVARLLDALDLPKVHLFGHSDGATIALMAAALATDRVISVMVEAPHVFVETQTLAGVAKASEAYRLTNLREKLHRHHNDVDAVFEFWVNTWLDPAFKSWTIEAFLPRITAPALVIQGSADAYATMAQLDSITNALPNAVRLELEGCGHVPHNEQPESVLRAVRAFMSRFDSPGSCSRAI